MVNIISAEVNKLLNGNNHLEGESDTHNLLFKEAFIPISSSSNLMRLG